MVNGCISTLYYINHIFGTRNKIMYVFKSSSFKISVQQNKGLEGYKCMGKENK